MAVLRLSLLHRYVALVAGAGIGLLIGALLFAGGLVEHASSPLFWVLVTLIFFGEVHPLFLIHRRNAVSLMLSTAFAFAMVLWAGPVPTATVLVLASVVADLWSRKAIDRVLFNAGQYAITVMASGATLHVVGFEHTAAHLGDGAVLATPNLWAIIPAAAVYFLVNHVLVGVAVALHMGASLRVVLTQNWGFELFTSGVLFAMAPPLLVVADRSLWLVPLLLIPVVAVYKGASSSLQKEHAMLYDGLTGLPNRSLFSQQVELALEDVPQGRHVGVMLLDLDRFKEVNDTLGHQAGDRLLRDIGPRLQDLMGDERAAARLGGDEFGILLPDVQDADEALAIAAEILMGLRRPFEVEGLSLEMSASVGIALYPEHGRDVSALMQRADVAMYVAKDNHGGVQLYSPERDRHSRRHLALVSDLRQAIDDGQLFLQYQPKADLHTGEIVGVEALVRWRHPRHGDVRPDEFIPLAERTGLILPLTAHVLEQAIKQCALWHRAGFRLTVAVNLSMQNLYDEQLPATVQDILGRHEVDPGWLELEITESSIMAYPEKATRALAELGSMGVRLAIDDFGTGYSSLGHLKQLPVDEVKIDRSFVQHMAQEDDDAVIVRSTIELARNLGIGVTAEGVENGEAWHLLARLGCDRVQGYYLSKPMNASELTVWLFEHRRERDQVVSYGAEQELTALTVRQRRTLTLGSETTPENVWC